MSKNPLCEVVVDALSASGDGVVTVDGVVHHVANALPGERVALKVHGRELAASTVLDTSPERVTPRCAVFDRCGGCAWQHASPMLQREARIALLRRAFPASLRDVEIHDHPSPLAYGWRTRARLAWVGDRRGVTFGFRARRDNGIVNITECPVLDTRLEKALPILSRWLGSVSQAGEVSIALGRDEKPVASIHPTSISSTGWNIGADMLAAGLGGVAIWAPGASAPIVHGDPRPVAVGADGMVLVLGVDGFAQAHTVLNKTLVEIVCERANTPNSKVLELYAGSGNFTVVLAKNSKSLTAVESVKEACVAMRDNLAARSITHVTVQHRSAEEACTGKFDVLVLDPPRTGARDVCEIIAKNANVKRIVYVSCDPATLGRDLVTLGTRYELTHLDTLEMFPQTAHIECVATLNLRRRTH
jgi:23S rRNA (uracil1939-C5)-methyltransferase